MSTLATTYLLIIMAGGLWMGVGLGIAGLIILYFFGGGTNSFQIATVAIWNMLYSFPLVALPLFILLGELLVQFELSIRVYRALTPLFERLPGKLLLSNVVLCSLFGATSGSSMATAATVGSAAYPELRAKGYNRTALLGSLAGSGTLGILIPPSIPIIIYASLTNVSVGASFVAAVIPAVIAVSLFLAYVMIQAKFRPEYTPSAGEVLPLRETLPALVNLLPVIALIGCVMGTIYFGLATVTESAALGVLASVIIGLMYKACTLKRLGRALLGTSVTCASIGFVMMGAMIFSMALAVVGLPREIVAYVQDLQMSPWMLLIAIYVFYFIFGMFIGATEMLVTTLPFTFPLILALGHDPVWFAVVIVILCEVGQITPPAGFVLFILKGIAGKDTTMGELARGSIPYIILLLTVLALITVYPQLATYLPSAM
ncbi:TRAP transporter large permease [Pollutimonas sp. M17]|uniref:TRAP transporter large permease n=1 Tax=Pollutimonas sp. M17 TaxID=2962065 RepID=UPI0021F4DA38|nr:TRAP transporter large permease subunit [Pollutimonas sp. M17]UYO93316.1 TRAP transporter large permease subunit [Pollutimonas sp. M17]